MRKFSISNMRDPLMCLGSVSETLLTIVCVFSIITVSCFLAASVFASETYEYDELKQSGTDMTAQTPSSLDDWERDPDWLAARELEEIGIDRVMGKRNRLEIDFSYDYLSNDFGTWKNFRLMYLRRELTFVCFFELQNFFREEGDGVQLVGGIYKDWNPWLYTYTALAAGTNAVYLPEIRFDQDFNFKFGKSRNYVLTLGGTYIDYRVNPSYLIFSAGLSGYFGKWIAGYRLFRNISIPGSEGSFSNSFELTYGHEGSHWSSLTLSFGNQAYLSTELVSPVRINQNSQLLLLQHRQWVGKNWGLYAKPYFAHVDDAYNQYGATLGTFWDF